MPDSSSMFNVFRQFAATMGASFEINDVLYELCDHAVSILDAAGAGVCLGNEKGELRFVTATSEQTIELERAQDRYQEGPCSEAYRTGEIVTVSDFDGVDRWPNWAAVAREVQLSSVVGLPLWINGQAVGALNVYDTRESRTWSPDDLEAARVLSDMAAAYLVRAGELAQSRQLAEQLQTALDTRVIIEQAKGMLARDHGISVDSAFALLRQHSRNTNVALRVIAHAVVELDLQLPSKGGSGSSGNW